MWRFVLGTPSAESLPCWRLCFHPDNQQQAQAARLIAAQCATLTSEQEASGGDLLIVPVADNEAVGCVEKTFEWFAHAVRAYPRAAYIAVTQDDAALIAPNLLEVLLRSQTSELVFGGRIQFSAFVEEPQTYRSCGWSMLPWWAQVANLSHVCEQAARPRQPPRGRMRQLRLSSYYPFAQGVHPDP